MKVRNQRIYTEVIWEWNESTQQLEQISEQSELYSGDLALATGPGQSSSGVDYKCQPGDNSMNQACCMMLTNGMFQTNGR